MKTIIKCPYCDYEYVPGEIFLPNWLIGQPKEVERDCYGHIIYSDDITDLKEEYICDKCNKCFIVEANIKFNAFENNIKNASDIYVTPKLCNKKLYLKEE